MDSHFPSKRVPGQSPFRRLARKAAAPEPVKTPVPNEEAELYGTAQSLVVDRWWRNESAETALSTAPATPADSEAERFRDLVGKKPMRLPVAPCHWGLMVATLILTALSVPLVYSASTGIAMEQHHGDPNFFLTRQLLFAVIGVIGMISASRLTPEQLRNFSWWLLGISIVGLVLTRVPHIGFTEGNVRRWVKIGPITIQFSELAKVALIGVMADFWSRANHAAKGTLWPWLATAGITAVPVALVLIQPHLSAALVLCLLPVAIAWYAGAPRWHFAAIFLPVVVLAGLTIVMCKTGTMPLMPKYQQVRIASHFGASSKQEDQTDNYQKEMAERALVHGGFWGRGVGQSLFKQGYLPAPHTDFIFAVIVEEWGVKGSLFLFALYGAIVFFCFQIGHGATDAFSALLCAGVGTLLGVQAVGNIGVVSGLLPVTGLPLPILTYGGTGLWCALLAIGLVLAISRSQTAEDAEWENAT